MILAINFSSERQVIPARRMAGLRNEPLLYTRPGSESTWSDQYQEGLSLKGDSPSFLIQYSP